MIPSSDSKTCQVSVSYTCSSLVAYSSRRVGGAIRTGKDVVEVREEERVRRQRCLESLVDSIDGHQHNQRHISGSKRKVSGNQHRNNVFSVEKDNTYSQLTCLYQLLAVMGKSVMWGFWESTGAFLAAGPNTGSTITGCGSDVGSKAVVEAMVEVMAVRREGKWKM